MNLRENRHITITNSKGGFLIPTRSLIEKNDNALKVKFIFDRTLRVPDFEYVIADNEKGYIRMVTSKGIEFNTGALFDQLFDWYDDIIKN
ncbi:hypothetical protein ACFQZI_10030 [Mucilaginibacter lutimaris]|uniref:GRAM domain-containing protein n=1 Tax=Mucilaginibacter lutimaris TaxID=931629 RepID=A0ABW2ZG93_9SPHI